MTQTTSDHQHHGHGQQAPGRVLMTRGPRARLAALAYVWSSLVLHLWGQTDGLVRDVFLCKIGLGSGEVWVA